MPFRVTDEHMSSKFTSSIMIFLERISCIAGIVNIQYAPPTEHAGRRTSSTSRTARDGGWCDGTLPELRYACLQCNRRERFHGTRLAQYAKARACHLRGQPVRLAGSSERLDGKCPYGLEILSIPCIESRAALQNGIKGRVVQRRMVLYGTPFLCPGCAQESRRR